MSEYFFVQKLKAVIDKDLPALIDLDNTYSKAKATKSENIFHDRVYTLYVNYIQLLNKLGACCDQLTQPQKITFIRRIYDMCAGRLLELKNELIDLDKSDFSYNEDVLNEMKLTVFDTVLNPPYHLAREKEKELKQREEELDALYEEAIAATEESGKEEEEEAEKEKEDETKVGETKVEETKDKTKEEKEEQESEEENDVIQHEVKELKETESEEIRRQKQEFADVVSLIQKHERARKYFDMFLNAKSAKYKNHFEKLSKTEQDLINKFAITLQTLWKRYKDKKMAENEKLTKAINLGLYNTCWEDMEPFKSYWEAKRESQREVRRKIHFKQDESMQKYQKAQQAAHAKYLEYQKMWKSHDLVKEIRQWFIDWYYATGQFPQEFPKTDEGGSELISKGLLPIPTEKELKEKDIEMRRKKRGKGTTKKDDKKTKEKDKEKTEKKEVEIKDRKTYGFTFYPSQFIEEIEKVYNEYLTVWSGREETEKSMEKFYMDLIENEQKAIADSEIRVEVDELMRNELKDLQALEKTKKKKGKKKKGGKSKGKGKKKKGKKKKDLLGDKTEFELFQELYNNKIILTYPRIYLSSFVGEPSYNALELRKKFKDPLHGLGEMRQLVVECIVLPLASKGIREKLPLKKSICILGPEGFGKKTLVYSSCTEAGALVFDLTPENIFGKYSGKKELNSLMNMVSKVSKKYQPSIIFIDGGHKIFYKKVPKAERKYKGKSLRAPIKKFVKALKKEDQILLLATSDKPWAAKSKAFSKMFEKFILVPKPEYGTVSQYFDETIMSFCNVPRNFNVSSLARVCDGFSVDMIKTTIGEILTLDRQMNLYTRPLNQVEFLDKINNYKKVTDKDMEKYVSWYKKWTPLGAMREEYIQEQLDILERKAKEAQRAKT